MTARQHISFPKACPARSEKYLRIVAALPCAHCGIEGHSQAAHADYGKGMGLKADDRFTYPACAPRPGIPGCHARIGTLALYPREERRALERRLIGQTLEKVATLRLWPKGLPLLREDDWAQLREEA